MPINPNIPLQVQRTRAPDPMQGLAQAFALKSAATQNALQELQMGRLQREDARTSAMRDAYAQTGGDLDAVGKVALQYGDVPTALSINTNQATIAAQKAAALNSGIKAQRETLGLAAQMAGQVTDEASYALMLQQARSSTNPYLAQLGASMPDTYDPQVVAGAVQAALQAKDRLELQMKDKQFGITSKETARHNRASEATAALRAQNSGPLALITAPDGTVTAVGGPNGVGPSAIDALARTRGRLKEAEGEGTTTGKFFGTRYVDILEAGDNALLEKNRLDYMQTLLKDVETGKFKGTINELKKAAKTVGVDLESLGVTDDVAPVEAAQILTGELALNAVKAAKLVPVSNTDLQVIQQLQPGIEKTPRGLDLIIFTRQAQNDRAIEVSKRATAYRKKHGALDEDFYAQMREYAEQNPIFPVVTDDAAGDALYAGLKAGTRFVGPDGKPRIKP